MGNLVEKVLEVEESNWLERDISLIELEEALNNSSLDKSPGPDGINIRYLKFLWSKIGSVLLDTLKTSTTSGFMPKGFNSSFISLIPKKDKPQQVTDFRPISLINYTSKLFTKILSTRLSGVVNKLVGGSQYGFIKGKQASDSILIVSEVFQGIWANKVEGVVLKLDFEKAFDTVNWSFLFELMEKIGFGKKWVSWIRRYLDEIKISILINGSLTREFSPQRGLRQGDPLSPLLFNLAGEVLSKLISRAKSRGLIEGVSFPNQQDSITHLQFADDVIIFVNNKIEYIKNIKSLLLCFQYLSGLKINFSKSQLYGQEKDSELLVRGAELLGCSVGSMPFTY